MNCSLEIIVISADNLDIHVDRKNGPWVQDQLGPVEALPHYGISIAYRVHLKDLKFPERYAVDPIKLVQSANESGEHAIFTCGCGTIWCAGIERGINVCHEGGDVVWDFSLPLGTKDEDLCEEGDYEIVFDRLGYIEEIRKVHELARHLIRHFSPLVEVGPHGCKPENVLSAEVRPHEAEVITFGNRR